LIETLETDDLSAPGLIADPYRYFGWLRENDPVHWNALFKTWVVTRHGDVVWLIRNHELFSSAIQYPKEPRDEYPPIDDADWELAEYLKPYRAFIILDRPEHLAIRQTIHRWFTRRRSRGGAGSWRRGRRSSSTPTGRQDRWR
jgi:cytochrome P450